VSGLADPESTIAVLGLSYKPASHVVEESQAIQIVKALVDRHYRVVAYDPLAGAQANQDLGGRALVLDSIAACLQGADVVLIANADPAFKALTPADFTDGSREVVVVDFWRALAPSLSTARGIKYIPYGCGTELAGAVADRLSELWAGTAASHVEGV